MNIGFHPLLDRDTDVNFKRLQDALALLPDDLSDYLTIVAFDAAMAEVDRFTSLEKWGPL